MKVKQKFFVHLPHYEWDTDYQFFRRDMASVGYVLVNTQEIEFEVPDDFDPTPVKIKMLEAEKAKVREEFNNRIDQIQEQISKLQAIGHEVAA